LDTIIVSQSKIIGWIFTMSDGKIKSKSRPKWTLSSVREKCTDFDGHVCAQMLVCDQWTHLSPVLEDGLSFDSNVSALVSTAQLQTHTYIEISFEKHHGIAGPKIHCYRLCDSIVKGQALVALGESHPKIFPTERLSVNNKKLIDLLKDKISSLVNLLEQRSKLQIDKITCVFVLEEQNPSVESEKQLKLHHCKEVLATRKKSKLNRRSQSSLSETRSEVSEITNVSRGCIRKTKCVGDFCTFNEIEEGPLAEMVEELDFNISLERDKATRRHRRHGDQKTDHEWDVEEDVSDMRRAAIIAATAKDPSASAGGVLSSSQAFKVPVKSLLLARNEMKIINEADAVFHDNKKSDTRPEGVENWSPLLLSWYHRTGRASVQKSLPAIPQSSGHLISQTLLHGISEEKDSNSTSPRRGSQSELTSAALRALDTGDFSPGNAEISRAVPFDLNDKPYHNSDTSSSKHIGRYYSHASVCERCYHVYKELDRLRKYEMAAALKAKRAEDENRAIQNLNTYQSERINNVNKLANQRVANYRLSQSKHVRQKKDEVESHIQDDDGMRVMSSGVPRGMLPPLPWQLKDSNKREEYEQQGSTFIRNIGSKAQLMANIAAEKRQQYAENDSYDDAPPLDPNYDWRKALIAKTAPHNDSGTVKSNSAGSQTRKRQKKVPPKKKFDAERLLHPYQRYFEALKRGETGDPPQKSDLARQKPPSLTHNHHSQDISTEKESLSLKNRSKSASTLEPIIEADDPSDILARKLLNSSQTTSMPSLPPLAPKYVKSNQSSANKIPSPTKKLSTPKKGQGGISYNSKQSPSKPIQSDDGDDDEEDEDDDGIGWSPFVVTAT
jgi:hypothetical protein